MDKLYLFKDSAQRAIINFYNAIFKIKRDLGVL